MFILGRLRHPKMKAGISTGPMILKIYQTLHFQNCRSKVTQFVKNDRLNALIILTIDKRF